MSHPGRSDPITPSSFAPAEPRSATRLPNARSGERARARERAGVRARSHASRYAARRPSWLFRPAASSASRSFGCAAKRPSDLASIHNTYVLRGARQSSRVVSSSERSAIGAFVHWFAHPLPLLRPLAPSRQLVVRNLGNGPSPVVGVRVLLGPPLSLHRREHLVHELVDPLEGVPFGHPRRLRHHL